jgi:hypothetical protein
VSQAATPRARTLSILAVISVLTLPGLCFSFASPTFAQDATFHVSPSVPGAVEADIRTLFQQSGEFLSADLGFRLATPVTIYIFGSQREIFDTLIDELGYSEQSARIVAAETSFFVIGQRIFINAGASLFADPPRRVDRARTIAHELAHIFHNDLMGSGAQAPLWIKEGFAVRFELRTAEHLGFHPTEQAAQEFLNLTLFAVRRGELVLLSDLGSRDRWDLHIRRASPERIYGQAFVAVDYLMRTRGQQAMLAYFRAFRSSHDAASNFADAFGLDVEAFQQEFQEYLASLQR